METIILTGLVITGGLVAILAMGAIAYYHTKPTKSYDINIPPKEVFYTEETPNNDMNHEEQLTFDQDLYQLVKENKIEERHPKLRYKRIELTKDLNKKLEEIQKNGGNQK